MSGYFRCACCGMDEMGSDDQETALCDNCAICACGEEGDDPQCRTLLIDGAEGIYVPQRFAHEFSAHWYGVTKEDRDILKAGPDHDLYWDAWDSALFEAWFYDAKTFKVWRLEQDGDLFAWVDCADTRDSSDYWKREIEKAEIEYEKEGGGF